MLTFFICEIRSKVTVLDGFVFLLSFVTFMKGEAVIYSPFRAHVVVLFFSRRAPQRLCLETFARLMLFVIVSRCVHHHYT